MKNIQTEYWETANTQPIPNNLFVRTKERMRQETVRSPRIRWSILAPVCALVVLATASATAYGVYQFTHPSYQPRINASVPPAVTQKAGATVEKTVTASDLAITVQKTVCDNKSLKLSLKVRSKDGKPLQESSEFRKSELEREKFAKVDLTIGGQDCECEMFRTDTATVPDTANFELVTSGDISGLSGKTATLTLKNLTDEVTTCENAGFQFRDLGQLYAKMTPEKAQNFINTGLFDVYSDKSLIAPSWTIPAGKQKIKFSNQFSDAFIDNIGFHKTGGYDDQHDVLYISITPGSKSEVPALKKLCFQNMDTMQPVNFCDSMITGNGIEQNDSFTTQQAYDQACQKDIDRKLTYNGNRVVIALSTFFDRGARSSDCSVNDLGHYRIAKNYKSETVIRCPGTWNIPFTLQFQDTTRKFTPNADIKTGMGRRVTIQDITISDLSLSFSGKYRDPVAEWNDSDRADLQTNNIKLILKDGTCVDAGVKVDGGSDAGGAFQYNIDLQSFVDADSVTAVEIFGVRVPLVNSK